jgi:hypothetical protein
MKKIKIKKREVYRGEELIGEIVGDRFPAEYRKKMKCSCDFRFIPKEGEPINLSMFAYFQDACNWLRNNL